MEHITNVLVYSNRCEVLDSHIFTVGDRGFPHIRLKFIYMFGAETLQGKQLELKYILPDRSYQVEKIVISGKDEALFPIHYSVFVNGGWTTLKVTIIEGANRISLDDIIIKTKRLEAGQEFQHKEVKAIVEAEITKISKKIKEFEEETKVELNTLKTNLSQNLETEKNSSIEALKEVYNTELKKLDDDVKAVVTKYLKENTDKFDGEITKLKNGKENSFEKNTAFNKNFGTTEGTVLEGDKLELIMNKFENLKRNSHQIMYAGGSPVPVGTTGKLPNYVAYNNILDYYFKIRFSGGVSFYIVLDNSTNTNIVDYTLFNGIKFQLDINTNILKLTADPNGEFISLSVFNKLT